MSETLDPFLIQPKKILTEIKTIYSIEEMRSISKDYKLRVFCPNEEIRYCNNFEEHYSIYPRCDAILLSTINPFALDRKGNVVVYDVKIFDIMLKYSDHITSVTGNGVNDEKATVKVKLLSNRYPSIDFYQDLINPFTFYKRMCDLGKETLHKIVIKMSGEFADYVWAMRTLFNQGYRNIICVIMRSVNHNRFKFFEIDNTAKGDRPMVREFPSVPLSSREYNRKGRVSCPACLVSTSATKYSKKQDMHGCCKCKAKYHSNLKEPEDHNLLWM